MSHWRIGSKIPLNVYEGDRPMFQCHTPEAAARIVALLNLADELAQALGKMPAYMVSDAGKDALAKYYAAEDTR